MRYDRPLAPLETLNNNRQSRRRGGQQENFYSMESRLSEFQQFGCRVFLTASSCLEFESVINPRINHPVLLILINKLHEKSNPESKTKPNCAPLESVTLAKGLLELTYNNFVHSSRPRLIRNIFPPFSQ